MRSLILAVICSITLISPSIASDWVEDDEKVHVYQQPTAVPQLPVMPAEDDSEPILFDVDGSAVSTIAPAFTLPQQVSAMEVSLLNRLYDGDGLLKRIERLEDRANVESSGNITERIGRLREQIPISQSDISYAQQSQKNTFLNPADVPWLNALGRGTRAAGRGLLNIGKSVDSTASSVLSSPEFWGLAVGLGAGIPLAVMANKSGAGMYPYGFGSPYNYGYLNPSSVYSSPYGFSPYGNTGTLLSGPGGSLFNPSFASEPGFQKVSGYTNRYGTYVQPYMRTRSDGNFYNNWSTRGNINPFNGRRGYRCIFASLLAGSRIASIKNQTITTLLPHLRSY
jgi:hypothetical protein